MSGLSCARWHCSERRKQSDPGQEMSQEFSGDTGGVRGTGDRRHHSPPEIWPGHKTALCWDRGAALDKRISNSKTLKLFSWVLNRSQASKLKIFYCLKFLKSFCMDAREERSLNPHEGCFWLLLLKSVGTNSSRSSRIFVPLNNANAAKYSFLF